MFSDIDSNNLSWF